MTNFVLISEEEHNEAKEKIEKYKEKVDRGPSAKVSFAT